MQATIGSKNTGTSPGMFSCHSGFGVRRARRTRDIHGVHSSHNDITLDLRPGKCRVVPTRGFGGSTPSTYPDRVTLRPWPWTGPSPSRCHVSLLSVVTLCRSHVDRHAPTSQLVRPGSRRCPPTGGSASSVPRVPWPLAARTSGPVPVSRSGTRPNRRHPPLRARRRSMTCLRQCLGSFSEVARGPGSIR